jgi:hypothetical protein
MCASFSAKPDGRLEFEAAKELVIAMRRNNKHRTILAVAQTPEKPEFRTNDERMQ